MLGSVVNRADIFKANIDCLRDNYPSLEEEVGHLEEFLTLGYIFPEIKIDTKSAPNVYAVRHDYRPLGAAGRSRFLVTYHATDPNPSPTTPYRTFTLLTITER